MVSLPFSIWIGASVLHVCYVMLCSVCVCVHLGEIVGQMENKIHTEETAYERSEAEPKKKLKCI